MFNCPFLCCMKKICNKSRIFFYPFLTNEKYREAYTHPLKKFTIKVNLPKYMPQTPPTPREIHMSLVPPEIKFWIRA